MPEGAVYVGRPTQWGNPFKVNNAMGGPGPIRMTREEAIRRYRYEIIAHNGGVVGFNQAWAQTHLRGKDLACWCPLDQPCHADVLLEIANA